MLQVRVSLVTLMRIDVHLIMHFDRGGGSGIMVIFNRRSATLNQHVLDATEGLSVEKLQDINNAHQQHRLLSANNM